MGRNNEARTSNGPSARGFAAMSSENQRAIARKGGAAVSRNREHMAAIGRKGGEASAVTRGGSRRAGSEGSSAGAGDRE